MTIGEYNKSVDLFSDNIYRFVIKQCGNEAVAKDIVQDSYEKLWIKYKEVSFEKVKSYLFTTAYRLMIDNFRRSNKLTNIENYESINVSHNNQYSDISEILEQALSKLPEIQQSLILLRDYEGYSYREIAEITKLNESQVKVYIYRARVFLKNYIVSVENIV